MMMVAMLIIIHGHNYDEYGCDSKDSNNDGSEYDKYENI
jgi:hypothetical protein